MSRNIPANTLNHNYQSIVVFHPCLAKTPCTLSKTQKLNSRTCIGNKKLVSSGHAINKKHDNATGSLSNS